MFVDRRGSREGKKTSLRQTDKAKKHATTAPANTGQGLMRTCHPTTLRPIVHPKPIFDAGCNLVNRQFENDFQRVVTRALKDGVSGMVMVMNDTDKIDAAITLCKWLPGVLYCAAGIHPNNISSKKLSDKQFAQMVHQVREKLILPEVVALLCGVDFTRDVGLRVVQEKFLREELKIAGELNLPVISLLSEEEGDEISVLVEIIKECREQFKEGLVHNFYGTESQLKQFIDLNLHVAISGIVTTEKHASVVNLIPQIPRDKFLLCSDSPYHTPQNIADSSIRESRNEPSNLPYVLQVCAKAYGITAEKLSGLVQENSKKLFNLDVLASIEEESTENDQSETKDGKKQVAAGATEKEKRHSKKVETEEEEEEEEEGEEKKEVDKKGVKGKKEVSEKSGKTTTSTRGKGKAKAKAKDSDEEVIKPRKGQQPPKSKAAAVSTEEEEEDDEEEEIAKPKRAHKSKGRKEQSSEEEEVVKSKKAQKPKARKDEEEEHVVRPKKGKQKGRRDDDSSEEEDVTVKEDFIKPKARKEEGKEKEENQKEEKQKEQKTKETTQQKTKETPQQKKQTKAVVSDIKNLKINDEDSDESGEVEYACKMCRTKLFTSQNLQSHQTVQGLKDGICRMYFLEKMEWMKATDEAEGRLACPKCDQKLGRFDADGISCSCGETVKPAYKVAKSRVDAIGDTTQTTDTDEDEIHQFGGGEKRKQKKKKGGPKKVTKGNLSLFRNKDYAAKKRESDSDE